MTTESEKSFDLMALSYAESLEWRLALKALPVVGEHLDTVLTHRSDTILKKRQEAFLRALHTGLEGLDESKVPWSFFRTDEFALLIRKALNLSSTTLRVEKVLHFAGIITGVLKGVAQTDDPDEVGEAMDVVEAMTLAEIRVLHEVVQIYESGPASDEQGNNVDPLMRMTKGGWATLGARLSQETNRHLDKHLIRLASLGLLKEITGTYFDYDGGVYYPTSYSQRLIDLLCDGRSLIQRLGQYNRWGNHD